MSRFFAALMEHEDLVKAMLEELVRKLKVALIDPARPSDSQTRFTTRV